MRNNKADVSVWLLRLYVFFVLFSVAGHAISAHLRLNPGLIAPVASAVTLLLGLSTSFFEIWKKRIDFRFRTSAMFFGGGLVELIGLGTGFPFGKYHYTSAWAPSVWLPKIGHFPLLLPFAWVLIVGSSALAASRFPTRFLVALSAASVATLIDLSMEAVLAGKMGYWVWDVRGPGPGGSPWMNSASWFLLSFVGAYVLDPRAIGKTDIARPIIVLAGQLLLMLGLGLS